MTEQRRENRSRQRFPVTVGRLTLFTANNSPRGFCTEAVRVFAPGTPVDGIIRARGGEFPYSGRVVWARAGDPRLNLRGRMGIEFVSVAPGLASVLESSPLR
jgi:hypothetical protein